MDPPTNLLTRICTKGSLSVLFFSSLKSLKVSNFLILERLSNREGRDGASAKTSINGEAPSSKLLFYRVLASLLRIASAGGDSSLKILQITEGEVPL